MDVEGAELGSLGFHAARSAPPQWCAGMLLMEFHPDKLPSKYPATLATLMAFVHWLEAAGIFLYHSEIISPARKFFGRFELAFINTTWMTALTSRGATNSAQLRAHRAPRHARAPVESLSVKA